MIRAKKDRGHRRSKRVKLEIYEGVGILLSSRFCVTCRGRPGFSPAEVGFFYHQSP